MKRELPAGWVPDPKGGYSKTKGALHISRQPELMTAKELVELYAQEANKGKPRFTVRRSKDESRLNKTEYAYLQWLRRMDYISWIGIQCITLKLADDTRYTPDFWTMEGDKLQARECKGHMRDDARVKLKVAARQYFMFEFWLVRKVDSMWNHELVSP